MPHLTSVLERFKFSMVEEISIMVDRPCTKYGFLLLKYKDESYEERE